MVSRETWGDQTAEVKGRNTGEAGNGQRQCVEFGVMALEADIVLVGHTHIPMMLRIGDKIVLNPGSVGLPSDGDPRAALAVIEDGVPRLERVEYDIEATEATVRRLDRKALPATVVDKLSHLLRVGGARI